jgi:hypothetical protein
MFGMTPIAWMEIATRVCAWSQSPGGGPSIIPKEGSGAASAASKLRTMPASFSQPDCWRIRATAPYEILRRDRMAICVRCLSSPQKESDRSRPWSLIRSAGRSMSDAAATRRMVTVARDGQRESRGDKQGNDSLAYMSHYYRTLSPNDRLIIDTVVGEQLRRQRLFRCARR